MIEDSAWQIWATTVPVINHPEGHVNAATGST